MEGARKALYLARQMQMKPIEEVELYILTENQRGVVVYTVGDNLQFCCL